MVIISLTIPKISSKKNEIIEKLEEIENPNEPNEIFLLQRTYPNKTFDIKAYQTALQSANQTNNLNILNKTNNFLSWQLEGPGNIGGRFNCIAVSPTNSAVMYAGSANGGLWKTTNNGVNWFPITDDFPYQAIGAIAINPLNANEIWIGMGDVNINGFLYTGNGVYKSTDAGATFTSLGLANTYVISSIKFNASNTNEVLISTMGNPFNKDNNRGIYKTTNSGLTFINRLFVNDSTGIIDMVQHPTNPSILYASSFTRLRTQTKSVLNGTENYVYKSIDFGQTWSILAGGLPNGVLHERIGISICKNNPSILYTLYSTSNGTTPKLYKSTNAGATWTQVLVNGSFDNSAYGNFGWYFGKIYIDDSNPNLIYIPGVDLQYSTDGGINWNMLTPPWWNYIVHADGHYMHFNSSTDFIYCTDGGLYRTYDGGVNWIDIENIPNNQFYSITENINNFGEYAGGVQDNGSVNGNATSINSYTRMYGGDGFKVEFAQNPLLVYAESQNGNIVFDDAYPTGNWQQILTDPGQNYNWFTPYFISPHNQNILFFAGQKVMKITGAPYGNYASISPNLHNPASPIRVQNISTINQSKIDAQKLFAGTADGKVWNTLNGGTTWNDITPFTGINYYVTQVMPSPNNASIVYATRSGYRANDNTPLVFKSINNGTTWVNISGDLPALAINDIEIMPTNENIIFIANDAGVYYTTNGGTNWLRLGNNMPFVATFDIKLNYNNTKLIAGTYGRSMYTINVSSIVTSIATNQTNANDLSLSIYPNPANDYIQLSSSKEISIAKLISIEGKVVLTTKNNKIDISSIASGNYILQATIDGKIISKKIIIN